MPYDTPKEFTSGSLPPTSTIARVLGGISTAASQASACQPNRLNLFDKLSGFAVKVFFVYIFLSVLDKFGIPYSICRSLCGKRIADNLIKVVDVAVEKYKKERKEFRKHMLEEVFPDSRERRAYMKRVAAKRSKLCCCCQRRKAQEASERMGKDGKETEIKGKDKGKDNKTTENLSGKSGAGSAAGSEAEMLPVSEIHSLSVAWRRSRLPIWIWVLFIFPWRALKEYSVIP